MTLEETIANVEQLLEQVSAALIAADPIALEQRTIALRNASIELALTIEQRGAAESPESLDLKKRLGSIGELLNLQRGGIARLAATNERQAAGLLPASTNSATYGDSLGTQTSKSGVPRIYRSVS